MPQEITPTLSISDLIIKQIEMMWGKELKEEQRKVVLRDIKDAAASIERRISFTATEALERLKHDSRL
jgi:hypothetical protein